MFAHDKKTEDNASKTLCPYLSNYKECVLGDKCKFRHNFINVFVTTEGTLKIFHEINEDPGAATRLKSMTISRDAMMVVCSYLETKEVLKKIVPLCKKLRNDVGDSMYIRQGRKCQFFWF